MSPRDRCPVRNSSPRQPSGKDHWNQWTAYTLTLQQLLSPSTLFFAHLIVLHILLFLHFLFHCTFYSYFSFYHIYALVLCYFYIICIFILLHCPLSGPDLIYISLLIIPCIIYYVTNKETLNLELEQTGELVFETGFSQGFFLHSVTDGVLVPCRCCLWHA